MSTTIALETHGLTKRYGSLIAVNNLSLKVKQGEIFGFLGPNGAGKTTSISMMCGLLKPTAGSVIIKGQSISAGDDAVRTRVGVCPQEIVLWERLTCLEQLQFMGRMYGVSRTVARNRSEKLLDDLGLSDKRNKQARTLSGGMQRRLNLAMALVHDPEIVVLDEPEAGLDPQSRVKVREYIQSLAQNKTVILTTHNMDEAERVADRVAIIDHGKLLVIDTPDALKRQGGHGDVIEISLLHTPSNDDLSQADKRLPSAVEETRFDPRTGSLIIRARSSTEMLPTILETLQALGLQTGEVKIRSNTLEDVFIQLTGRGLRE